MESFPFPLFSAGMDAHLLFEEALQAHCLHSFFLDNGGIVLCPELRVFPVVDRSCLDLLLSLFAPAKELAAEFIPEGSTVDRELNFLAKQWNRMISKEAYNNLTEDVNSLIRDYTRRVCNTLTAQSFTKERIENLADALVRTPNMQKIQDQKALTEYVQLYPRRCRYLQRQGLPSVQG